MLYKKTPDLMIILWYSMLAASQTVTDTPAVGVDGWRKKLLAHFLDRDGTLCVLTTNWAHRLIPSANNCSSNTINQSASIMASNSVDGITRPIKMCLSNYSN
jgi:hypothetical protein